MAGAPSEGSPGGRAGLQGDFGTEHGFVRGKMSGLPLTQLPALGEATEGVHFSVSRSGGGDRVSTWIIRGSHPA